MPSGAEPVVLAGPAMVGLLRAVAALGEVGLGRYAIVGGVAVTARLGRAHRATVDVDTVVDETTPPDAIQALLAHADTEPDPDPAQLHRVTVSGTRVEILGVGPASDADLENLAETDALFVGAHVWALETATPLTVVAASDPAISATAPFATAGALVAMKLHAIQTRSALGIDKRGGDAWDLYQLLLDLNGDDGITAELLTASPTLRRLVATAADRILVSGATRTRGWLRTTDHGGVTTDDLRFLGHAVVRALDAK